MNNPQISIEDQVNEKDKKNDVIPHEDRVLFGTTALKVSDQLMETIDAALVEGVSSMPRLASKEPLLDLLRKSYKRNCNILEAYMARNIFSIQSLPPTRRKNIVHAFSNETKPEIPTALVDVTNHIKTHSQNQKEKNDSAQVEQEHTEENISNMEQELIDMRLKLLKLKNRRTKLRIDLEQISIAEKTLSKSNTISSQPAMIKETVSKMMRSKENLEELTNVGTNLVKDLDEKKQSRSDEIDRVAVAKKPRLSPERQYEQDRKFIQGSKSDITQIPFLKLKTEELKTK